MIVSPLCVAHQPQGHPSYVITFKKWNSIEGVAVFVSLLSAQR